MKKVLIYFDEENLKPAGGPGGYLFNLKQGLKYCQSEIEIDFLHSSYKKSELLFKVYKSLPASLLTYIQKYRTYKKYLKIVTGKTQEHISGMDHYDAIHFHSTQALYKCIDQLRDYHGKVILTSHTPKAPHCEILEDELRGCHGELYRALEKMDICAFDRADCIVFPCIDAEEPYYHTWGKYKEVRKNNKEKYRYLLTGCRKENTPLSRREARKRYDIDNDMFVVSFIGRHNEVKGYDRLKKIASEILSKEKKIMFLIAGEEKPLKRLKSPNWKETGWIDDITPVVRASDLFILPNRETFFDLILLEVMSMGIPLLLSNTGGNKYFGRFGNRGIILFENEKDAVEKLLVLKSENRKYLSECGRENEKIFDLFFGEKVFARAYLNLMAEILGEKRAEINGK